MGVCGWVMMSVRPARTDGHRIMNRTVLCSIATLGIWSCLFPQDPVAAPVTAQVARPKSTGTHLGIHLNDLFQHWVHSSEEEQPGGTVQIFRPATSINFPPSRFRMAYKFAPNGACEFYFLSPDDAHHFKPCNWSLRAGNGMILRISANGQSISYRIVQLSGMSLQLMPLEPRRTK